MPHKRYLVANGDGWLYGIIQTPNVHKILITLAPVLDLGIVSNDT